MRKLLFLLLTVFAFQYASAQTVVLKGTIKDTSEKKSLFNAVVLLVQKKDSTLVSFTRSDKEGRFQINELFPGKYLMLITYPKFADFGEEIEVQNTDIDFGNIALTQKSLLLKEVIVRTGQAIRIKGDTTEFTADSFAVKEGSTVEDLLKVLPGFQVNSKGEITAQGKRVEKVLVDGEEFFGDDPTMATQNLSAKIVDKVQVFDTKTEQQNLTGIQTGNEGKTVNIKLKEDKKKGAFGKLIAGSDFNEIVDAKGLYNRFTGKKKVALYGTISDINTGSLNWEDQQKLGLENDMEYDEIGGYYYSFGTSDEFSEWSLRGLPHAYTAGGLFSNKWNADKQNVNASYRYNKLNTDNDQSSFTQSTFPFITNTNKYIKSTGINEQHAVTGKYEWKIDSLISLKFTTSGIYKTTGLKARTESDYLFDSESQQKTYVSDQRRDNDTKRLQNDNSLQYKQLFKKKNRQLLATFRYGITEDNQQFMLYSNTDYFTNNVFDSSQIVDQMKDFDGRSRTIGGKLTFSEPLSTKWNLVLDYAHNRNNSESYRNSFNKSNNGKYDVLDAAFSNNFDMNAYSHSSLAILRFADKKLRFAFGSGISTVKLKLNNLDNNIRNDYDFLNLTPQAQINYQLKQQTSISFNYRGTTRQPTIDQLQPIRNNNDPLYEMIGNPDLKVAFSHNLNASYHQYKVLSGNSLYGGMSYNIINNAIANSNTIDPSGKRTSMPINVEGNHTWNFYSSWNKGRGQKKLNYGLRLNGNGGEYNSFVNADKNTTNYKNLQLSFNLGDYSKPDKYYFSFGPKVGYNASTTVSVKRSATNNYYTYGGYANGFVTLPGKLELTSDANFDLQQKIENFGARSNIILWNASLARKIFKDKSGKIFLVANDLLDQNKGFTRNISSNFISEERYSRISRYFLLKFEWTFNKMPGAK